MVRSKIICCASVVALCGLAGGAQAACSNERPLVFDWDPIALPKPTNLCDFVKDEAAAIALGKAFFWDMQVGSDGVTACASCHFHAGTDNRVKNQLSPHGAARIQGPRRVFRVGRTEFHAHGAGFPIPRAAGSGEPELDRAVR